MRLSSPAVNSGAFIIVSTTWYGTFRRLQGVQPAADLSNLQVMVEFGNDREWRHAAATSR